ncbi:RluA family pseudouridine synthase [Enterococcus canis]|nr:RluA family pseudouridine synthase [Enterococcus canis]
MELTITLPADFAPMPLTEVLEKEWLIPRKVRHFLRTRRQVQVNQVNAPFHQLIQPGDVVHLVFEESDYPVPTILPGDAAKVAVLYEDEQLIVVNKPAGMKTHPNQPNEQDTLLNHLAAYLAPAYPYVVHRLDKETSGVILFAKNPVVLPILGRLLADKAIYRRYQAIVQGTIQTITITKKIGRDRHDRRKRIIDEHNGKAAVTHITVVHHLPGKTAVYCQLETGRTHQIRVHLAAMGHPIIGDPLYGQAGKRLMLHAEQLTFSLPFTQEKISVTAPGFW